MKLGAEFLRSVPGDFCCMSKIIKLVLISSTRIQKKIFRQERYLHLKNKIPSLNLLGC